MTDRAVAGLIVLIITSLVVIAYLETWRGKQRMTRTFSSVLMLASCGMGALWLGGVAIAILSDSANSPPWLIAIVSGLSLAGAIFLARVALRCSHRRDK